MDSRPFDSAPFDLAVVGAGLNGSLLALAAGETGLSTALIDRVALASLTEAGFEQVSYGYKERRNGLCFEMRIQAEKPTSERER